MTHLKKYLGIGLALEVLIFIACYVMSTGLAEAFKFAARYSGRLSLIVFLIAMWQFILNGNTADKNLSETRALTAVFAVLHYIHLFLLMMNVKLNAVNLIPFKLAGGALAYLMILFYPVLFSRFKSKKGVHAIYFLYVGFVMAMTYIARIKGDFEGASPEVFHKIGLGAVAISMIYFIYKKLILSKP